MPVSLDLLRCASCYLQVLLSQTAKDQVKEVAVP